jgi:hypothetical protein
MAPPITVDIMVVLLGGKAIARGDGQQARRLLRTTGIQAIKAAMRGQLLHRSAISR